MRQLTALFILLPTTALAEVCDKQRPDWAPEYGPATGLDELVFLFTSLPGLGILGALMLAVLTGQKRYFAIATVFAALVGAALSLPPDELTRAAIAEGCVGPQTIAITTCAVIAVLSAASLAWLWLRDRAGDRI